MSRELLRKLPKVDSLLDRAGLTALLERLPRALVLEAVRAELDDRRAAILAGSSDLALVEEERIQSGAERRIAERLSPSLRSVVNATGVVLHTNLGRAPLGREILQDAVEIAASYSNLEYDLEQRQRGSRYTHCAALLRDLTGAEDSLVVNNNAAAVVLMLAATAAGREVIVSRGELIEIGGSFRLPEIFRTSGARLVEVGSTNRTHPRDYRAAITGETAMLLKVHRSNFEIVGFTSAPTGQELSEIAREARVVAAEDLGSGCMVDLSAYGIDSHTPAQQIDAGLDLVTFSGDKMLGGPQAGIIVGRRDLVQACRKHPLTRAFRVDKLTLATLERSLIAYLDGSWARALPTLGMLTVTHDELCVRAKALSESVEARLGTAVRVAVEPSVGRVGGGALPLCELPGKAVRVRFPERSSVAVDNALRAGAPAIVCRLDDGALVFDVRTLLDGDIPKIVDQLATALSM